MLNLITFPRLYCCDLVFGYHTEVTTTSSISRDVCLNTSFHYMVKQILNFMS